MNQAKKTVTLADVARVAGISKTTASHALSGKGWVSAATRETVVRVASEMGFEVDPLARLLSNGRSEKTIGFFTLDIDLSSRTRQMQIIQAQLNDMGYSVPIYAYGYRGRDALENQLELMNNLLAQRPRAIVCNTSGVRDEVLERLQKFVDEGGVAVCYGYSRSAPVRCDQVIYAEGESHYLAARHLIELGHRDIGLFNVGYRKPAKPFLTEVQRALGEVGAQTREKWLFGNDGTRRYEEDGARLGDEFLALKSRPSAMIVANDYAAVAFMARVTRGGISIPENLSVVGHDDDAIAPFGVVALTTISSSIEAVTVSVIELLNSRLLRDYSGEPRLVTVRGELVVRDSTAAPR
ncbi:MAG: LacI family transcriptional regulator [Armatimonadetes bacterium]|nr:LacI family transcriptional regulator [Armatimonadota bacterium]